MMSHYGTCYAKLGTDDRIYGYVNIPKCASSFMRVIWDGAMQQEYRKLPKDTQFVVVLRNPLERWFSGVAQVVWDQKNPDWNAIMDQVVLEDHTEPQVKFLDGLDFDRVTWFKQENNLQDSILDYVSDKFVLPPHNFGGSIRKLFNISFDDVDKRRVLEHLKVLLKLDPDRQQHIIDFYKDDYELYNSATYFNNQGF